MTLAPKRRWFQFATSSLLLATAFAGICAGAVIPWWRDLMYGQEETPWEFIALMAVWTAPVMVPLLFISYFVGRRTLTSKAVLAFAGTEFIAFVLFYYLK